MPVTSFQRQIKKSDKHISDSNTNDPSSITISLLNSNERTSQLRSIIKGLKEQLGENNKSSAIRDMIEVYQRELKIREDFPL